jgi:septum formation protein
MIELPSIVLASGSPRRAEILTAVGWKFKKHVPDIDETESPGEAPADYVSRLAREKAQLIGSAHPGEIVLGADTTVVLDDEIIGKPVDLDDAGKMLARLSGEWHEVLTGVAFSLGSETVHDVQRTRVKFAQLSPAEISYLVTRGSPLDKAGGYAVQGEAALFIEQIEGDYWNVVGLPVSMAYGLVRQLMSSRER